MDERRRQDDRMWDLVFTRLDKMEEKIDDLQSFKSWIIGAGAAISAFVSFIVTWLTSHK